MSYLQAKQFFDQHEFVKSLEILNACILSDPIDYQLFLLRGKICFKMQKWGDAMNDYSMVLELVPDNQEAKTGLELCRNILGYFNPDMFNP